MAIPVIKEFTTTTKLNMVGGRYIKDNRYVDVTDNYYCIGTLDNPKEFGLGIDCNEETALKWLS